MQQTKVLTPTGFKCTSSIAANDILLTNNNTECVVAQVDYEDTPIYHVTFQDGRSLDVGEDQLWDFHPAGDPRQKVKPTTFLKKLVDHHATKQATARKRLPILHLVAPTDLKSNVSELPVPPYTLGVILGDGYISDNGYATITNLDTEIIDRVEQQDGFSTCGGKPKQGTDAKSYFVYGISEQLCSLGLDGKRSATKFIPEQYINSTVDNRFAMVQGLMDTDGYVCSKGNTYYDTVSPSLKQNMIDILRSLGYTATVSSKVGSYKKDGIKIECQVVYTLYIRGLYQHKLFSMKRKVARCKDKTVGIRIDNIEFIGNFVIPKITLKNTADTMVGTGYIPLLSRAQG